jgi:prepilin-type N-terminal cleavage/methylation domain-containing protein
MKNKFNFSLISNGFTLVELLIVIAVMGILSSIVFSSVKDGREKAYLSSAKASLKNIYEAIELYIDDNNGYYPPDTNRDIPPGLEQYLANNAWPKAPWPGSLFDWDNWDDPDTREKIYQISIRFCPGDDIDECRFPSKDWAEDFDVNSSVFFCISGPCRAHIDEPTDYPGYCVNCGEPEYPYGLY